MLCSFFVKSSSSHRLTTQIRHNDRNNASKFLYKLYCHIASCFAELMPVEGETLGKKLLQLLWASMLSIRVNRASRLARWMMVLATASDLRSSYRSQQPQGAHIWIMQIACQSTSKQKSRKTNPGLHQLLAHQNRGDTEEEFRYHH